MKDFYVDNTCSTAYTPNSSLKSWGMRLATRVRCCRKTPSVAKTNAGSSTYKEACICTRSLAGISSLWSVIQTRVATAKADALKQEWDLKVYNFL